jgi:hypothetical protein
MPGETEYMTETALEVESANNSGDQVGTRGIDLASSPQKSLEMFIRSEATHADKGAIPDAQTTMASVDFRGLEVGQKDSDSQTTAPTQGILPARIIEAKSPCNTEHELAQDRMIASNSAVISRSKKFSALLLITTVVLPLATLDLWTRRQPMFTPPQGLITWGSVKSSPVEHNSQDTSAPDLKKDLPKLDSQPSTQFHHGQHQKSQPGVEYDSKTSSRKPLGMAGSSVSRAGQLRRTFLYPVIHEHALGRCRGTLEVTEESIAFIAPTDSKGRFNAKLEDITGTELGDRLKIRLGNKTYRFRSSIARDKEENRATLNSIYQQLIKLRAEL